MTVVQEFQRIGHIFDLVVHLVVLGVVRGIIADANHQTHHADKQQTDQYPNNILHSFLPPIKLFFERKNFNTIIIPYIYKKIKFYVNACCLTNYHNSYIINFESRGII